MLTAAQLRENAMNPPKMVKVEAVRGFIYEGRAVAPGDRVNVPAIFANELVYNQKAIRIAEVAPVATKKPAGKDAPDAGGQ
jgi:hypothetical protein